MTSIRNDSKPESQRRDELSEIRFVYCNFSLEAHRRAFVSLINQYRSDPMGGSDRMTEELAADLVTGMTNHPASFVLFVQLGDTMIGAATCFINFSTFKAKPYINVHDVIIDNRYRGLGVGTSLMNELIAIARVRACCKVTLEVREDNVAARALYRKLGFADTVPPMTFWTKTLDL